MIVAYVIGALMWLGFVALVLGVLLIVGQVIVASFSQSKPHRDLCKNGCGIVHSMVCEDGCIVGGMPFVCERAYSHRGDHEATGSSGWVAHWTDDHPERQRRAVSFEQMMAIQHDQVRAKPRLIL